MQERYTNRKLYFDEQCYTTEKYVIPYIEQYKKIDSKTKVLEIGCGEGGNLQPFVNRGCQCIGIDINEQQIKNARIFFSQHTKDQVDFICNDIYIVDKPNFTFDVIFLRDVIEHIHNQEKFMAFVKKFLKPDGVIFFAFPPWQMPFGGHQQVSKGFTKNLPFIHLLPKKIYAWILKKSGNTQSGIDSFFELKDTGISIERFERIFRKEGFKQIKKDLYFINPNYEIKFKLKPRKCWRIFNSIIGLRNFYITAAYYLLKTN
ncbi:MAG: class I SAM-dependent methyltransferase [Bacteroidales bacterium]